MYQKEYLVKGTRLSTEEVLHNKSTKTKINKLRYAEYYGQQEIFDKLYKDSKDGLNFTKLMKLITSDNNILMAYRSIKRNKGSNTPVTEGLTF